MFVDLQDHVWRADLRRLNLDSKHKVILARMASACRERGACCPTVAALAHETSLSKRAVQKSLRQLRDAGLIVVLKQGGSGRGTPTLYRLDLDAIRALAQ